MQVAVEMPAVPALVALAATVGRRYAIHPKANDDWQVVPNLWGAIIARPGKLKTPTLAESVKPIRRLVSAERDRKQELRELHEPRLESLRAREAAMKNLLRRAHEGKSKRSVGDLESDLRDARREARDLEESLSERRYLVNDATVEKVGELLSKNPGGLLLERDELAGWLRALERDDRKGDREFYLEAWNGTGGYTYDRIGRGTVEIPAMCLSIIGGMQPTKLQRFVSDALAGGYAADGLLQRFQMLVWPEDDKAWKLVDQQPDTAARERAFRVFEELERLPLDTTNDGIPTLRFSSEAQRLFYDWLAALEEKLRTTDLGGRPAFESHLAKYRSLMPSLALLFELANAADRNSLGTVSEVSLDSAGLAGAWCDFLELHARKVFAAELEGDAQAAHALARKIRERAVYDGMAIREIRRKKWSGLATDEVLNGALSTLEGLGWIKRDLRDSGTRPSPIVRVNPSALQEVDR